MENFMDKYRTPEEFIREEILKNRGTECVVFKADLIAELEVLTDKDLTNLSKGQLFDMLVEKKGKDAYTMFPVGVASISFQIKFDIDHTAVKRLMQGGVIKVTGKRRFRKYGRNCYADLYSPYDYFQLSRDEIHSWLEAHPPKKRKAPASD